MFELKKLHAAAIPEALRMIERYRLLNEPREAESICLDILEIEPNNGQALIGLLLSLTDQFDMGDATAPAKRAQTVVSRLPGEYERAYYGGIIYERLAKARLKRGGPRSSFVAHEELTEAMECFEAAEKIRPPANDDAILRWNACARLIMSRDDIRHEPEEQIQYTLE